MKFLNEHTDIMTPPLLSTKALELALLSETKSYEFYHGDVRYTWYISTERVLFPQTECKAQLVSHGHFGHVEATMEWSQNLRATNWSKALSNSWIQFVNPALIKQGVDTIE